MIKQTTHNNCNTVVGLRSLRDRGGAKADDGIIFTIKSLTIEGNPLLYKHKSFTIEGNPLLKKETPYYRRCLLLSLLSSLLLALVTCYY